MNLSKRIKAIESVKLPAPIQAIDIELVDCSQQVKNPELFKRVPKESSHKHLNMYRYEPIDPNFKCNLYCCNEN